jgi:hypothetical protein
MGWRHMLHFMVFTDSGSADDILREIFYPSKALLRNLFGDSVDGLGKSLNVA